MICFSNLKLISFTKIKLTCVVDDSSHTDCVEFLKINVSDTRFYQVPRNIILKGMLLNKSFMLKTEKTQSYWFEISIIFCNGEELIFCFQHKQMSNLVLQR